jgi:ABC-type Zn uptake system ZnuABC Zn-binding protein ZnuA
LVRPHHCAVFPQLGANHKEGYFDTGNDLNAIDPHVYVSVVAVKEMAKQLGYVPPEDHSVALAQRDAALSRIETLEQELQEKQQVIAAVHVIKSAGFVAEKKRGPKPKQPERSAA